MQFRLVCVLGLILVSLGTIARADDAEEIKKLIPAAAGMARGDFEKLATADTQAKASDLEEKTLTLMLLLAKPPEDAKAKEQFRFLTPGPIKASAIAAEIYRSWSLGGAKVVLAPVTMIHANRITKVTCDVQGDTAKGVVAFEVPKLYAGQVDYVARKRDGAWRIEEFALPAYGIHVVRGENGKWQDKSKR